MNQCFSSLLFSINRTKPIKLIFTFSSSNKVSNVIVVVVFLFVCVCVCVCVLLLLLLLLEKYYI